MIMAMGFMLWCLSPKMGQAQVSPHQPSLQLQEQFS